MKAIILAAGLGTRFTPHHLHAPQVSGANPASSISTTPQAAGLEERKPAFRPA